MLLYCHYAMSLSMSSLCQCRCHCLCHVVCDSWLVTLCLENDYSTSTRLWVWLCSLSTSLWFWHRVASDWWPLMTYDDVWLMMVDFCNLIIVKTPHLSIINLLALLTFNLWPLIYFCLGSLIWLPATNSVLYGLGSRTSHFIVTGPPSLTSLVVDQRP